MKAEYLTRLDFAFAAMLLFPAIAIFFFGVIRQQGFFNSGCIEYFGGQGIYWVLFKLGRANQWFQYNNLQVFLDFLLCKLLFCCLFLFII